MQPGAMQPSAVQPTAVKPAAVKARPAPKAKVAQPRSINPGDRICGQCGTGNDPQRRFCNRCGASLKEAEVFTLTFWQRIMHRLRHRKVRAAGDRPTIRRRLVGGSGPGWLASAATKLVILAVVVIVILSFVGPWKNHFRHDESAWYHDASNFVHASYNPIHPLSAIATSQAPGHPPAQAIDGASNTSWASNAPGAGVGQALTINFDAPSTIDKIGLLIGDQDTPQAYLSEPRPELIHVSFTGSRTVKTINLKDSPTFQAFTLKAEKATSMTIRIDSVYASAQGQNASLAEVELFSLKR
jgi:hypothetical protein